MVVGSNTRRKRLLPVRVVIASPDDASRERRQAVAALLELNETVAPSLGLTLQPVTWERHAFPSFHEVGPQAHIDETLKIRDSDLLIAIFRTRFGSPVHDAESGTEHEIRIAYDSWRRTGRPQVMMYFLDKPIARTDDDVAQLQKIIELRRSYPEALYSRFKPSTFRSTFLDHVAAWARNTFAPRKPRQSTSYVNPDLLGAEALPSLPINPEFRFDNFVVGRSNELVYAATKSVAENPGQSFNPLVIYGYHGLGKTHLLHAFANYVSNSPLRVAYVTCDRFIQEVSCAEGKQELDVVLRRYAAADALLMDNVHLAYASHLVQAALAGVVARMYSDGRQVLLVSSLRPAGVIDQLMRSQFEWGLTADVVQPDDETRQVLARVLPPPQRVPHDLLGFSKQVMTNEGEAAKYLNDLQLEQFAYALKAAGFSEDDVAWYLSTSKIKVHRLNLRAYKRLWRDTAFAVETHRIIERFRTVLARHGSASG